MGDVGAELGAVEGDEERARVRACTRRLQIVGDGGDCEHPAAIVAEFGRNGVRQFLSALRETPQLDAAAQRAFELSLPEFDRRFVAYVMSTLARR